jgi:hypothetical protein
MKFGKMFNNKGIWQWAELTEQEVEQALKELLVHNINEASSCMKAIQDKNIPEEIGKIIMEKSLFATYTWLNCFLDMKILTIKEKKSYKPFKPFKATETEKIPSDFGKKAELGESEVEKAFNKE